MHLTDLISRGGTRHAAGRIWASRLLDALIGISIAGVGAVAATALGAGHSWKNLVPIVFTVVLLVIAALFGSRVGIVSTVLAAIIFADFLFGPTGSLNVASDAARSNLGWMLLIGLAFSLLFAPPTSGFRRR